MAESKVSKAQRDAADRWDAKHMVYQTIKVKKTLLDNFKNACAVRGDRVNTVLCASMEQYVNETPNAVTLAAMAEADAITCDPTAKRYTDLDELFADLNA